MPSTALGCGHYNRHTAVNARCCSIFPALERKFSVPWAAVACRGRTATDARQHRLGWAPPRRGRTAPQTGQRERGLTQPPRPQWRQYPPRPPRRLRDRSRRGAGGRGFGGLRSGIGSLRIGGVGARGVMGTGGGGGRKAGKADSAGEGMRRTDGTYKVRGRAGTGKPSTSANSDENRIRSKSIAKRHSSSTVPRTRIVAPACGNSIVWT